MGSNSVTCSSPTSPLRLRRPHRCEQSCSRCNTPAKNSSNPFCAYARRRQEIITANTELQERELIKLSRIITDLADALGQRGLDALTAWLAVEAGIAVFKTAFEEWATTDDDMTLLGPHRQGAGQLTELIKRSNLR